MATLPRHAIGTQARGLRPGSGLQAAPVQGTESEAGGDEQQQAVLADVDECAELLDQRCAGDADGTEADDGDRRHGAVDERRGRVRQ